MCGICGYVNLRGDADWDPALIGRMTRTLVHRGPDEEGYHIEPPCALGMRRLRIIDVHTGSQPVYNEDESVCVVFNGEIYNYIELREQLKAGGHRFTSASDTEVLVHLYEEHGPDLCEHLNGMFAFAIWDRARSRLLLARDRMGQKPLFYYHDRGRFVFASELKAIRARPDTPATLNPLAFCLYLIHEYVPTPLCIYSGFRKLQPGNVLTVDVAEDRLELAERPFWSLKSRIGEADIGLEEAAERFSELLSDAVRIRMRADVPYGTFLSGGIDSSAVTEAMIRASGQPVHSFSIGFESRAFDESPWSTLVAKHLGTEHHLRMFSTDDALALVPGIPEHLDEPMGDASFLPTWLLSRFAREQVTMALGGDGGDELMGGYPTYFAHQVAATIPDAVTPDVKGVASAMARLLPVQHGNLDLGFKIRRFVSGLGQGTFRRNTDWMGSTQISALPELLSPDFLTSELRDGVQDFLSSCAHALHADGLDVAGQAMLYDQRGYLMDEVLVKADRASMAASLEVRAPMLDYRIVEFLNSLPTRLKLHRGKGKRILKAAMADRLPRSVLYRGKRGFAVPVARWLRGQLREQLHEALAPDRLRRQGLLNPEFVAARVDEHMHRRADNRKLLWTLLVFQLWLDRWTPDL